MLVGGAFADRYSPRAIMLISDVLRLIFTILLAVMILSGWLQLWVLYILALMFGTISGFFCPASGAMMPLLVKPEELIISNSIYQGTSYLSSFIGPVLAGGLIALFAHGQAAQSEAEMTGIAAAFAVDALSFLVSVSTLILMKWQGILKPQAKTADNIFTTIKEGITYLWRDDLLRTLFILMLAINFLFVGPMLVGIPVRRYAPDGWRGSLWDDHERLWRWQHAGHPACPQPAPGAGQALGSLHGRSDCVLRSGPRIIGSN
jgi:MFS family permease